MRSGGSYRHNEAKEKKDVAKYQFLRYTNKTKTSKF